MSDHGAVIAESRLADTVTLTDLNSDTAESLSDLVDDVLADKIRGRLREAEHTRVRRENWRSIYFDKKPARTN